MTKFWNFLIYALLAAAGIVLALPPSALDVVPLRWKPYVAAALAAAAWLQAHRNLFVNPDGTPARVAYLQERKEK